MTTPELPATWTASERTGKVLVDCDGNRIRKLQEVHVISRPMSRSSEQSRRACSIAISPSCHWPA